MHIYFCGIGTGTGPLALLALEAGWEVSGSDKQDHEYISYLKKHGVTEIHIGQTVEAIAEIHKKKPIDWLVYSSAVPRENPNHPEIIFAQENNIHISKRDELLNKLLRENDLKLIAIAGTHGKTTTTAMVVWLFKQLDLPIAYSLGAKTSFSDMAALEPNAEFFAYEADEYDRNFLHFDPYLSIITGIAYDHPDVYPTEISYRQAFADFISKSTYCSRWPEDISRTSDSEKVLQNTREMHALTLSETDIPPELTLHGLVNRRNAWQVIQSVNWILDQKYPIEKLIGIMNSFPGVTRRFEKIAYHLYSDYAHTPEKIRGAIQVASEAIGSDLVVVYEGLHNTRQHFIKDKFDTLFSGVKTLYVVPSYLAREDTSLEMLTPEKLVTIIGDPEHKVAAQLDDTLKNFIEAHIKLGEVVLCLSAGGGGSLDEWLRREFK